MNDNVTTAIQAKAWKRLAEIVSQRFGVQVSPKVVAKMFAARKRRGGTNWSDCSWLCWIKNRLRENKTLVVPHAENTHDKLSVLLHVFFLCISETPEMLTRLRVDPTRPRSQVARSKVSTTQNIISPVNTTAERVSGIDKR